MTTATTTDKIKINQLIIVEGKYDKAKLSSLIDGMIISLDGFSIYKNKEKAELIRAVAKKQGAILLTDSDRAGFQLRGFLKSLLKDSKLTQIYTPQIAGKEKRKKEFSKEGFLGVEGIDAALLRELFEKAHLNEKSVSAVINPITRLDFYEDGLSGGENSSKKRSALLNSLGLPCYISSNGLLEVINSLVTREEYTALIKNLD